MIKVLIRSLLGIVVLVVLVAGGLFIASQQEPSVASGLKPVATSAAAARSFTTKVETMNRAAAEAKRTGKAQAVEVSFSEEELTTKVATATAQHPSSSGFAATNTQIHLSGTNIIATSTVTVSGLSVNLGIVAEPAVVDGQTQIMIREIQTGALTIPDAVMAQINAQIASALAPSRLGLPFDVSQLAIIDGALVIRGTANP